MQTFEWIVLLLFASACLAEVARRIGAPYPTLLALGGVGIAFLPGSPKWTLDPELALTLFVAPVLLDAAYDTSIRDLRLNWKPVTGLVVAAVGTTVIGVALVCQWLVPAMPWVVALALGAIVAPPDAAAASAVMRQVGLPHRLLSILEGESLLNDATALFIYRIMLMTLAMGSVGAAKLVPLFLVTVVGSIAVGVLLSFVMRRISRLTDHVPTSLLIQFACTFGVWILAEKMGLSGILTMVAFAMALARSGGPPMPARMRVPILASWEIVVFILNAVAFVLIGMQLRPIWERLGTGAARADAMVVAISVLVVTVATRFLWVMTYGALGRRKRAKLAPQTRPRTGWGADLVISWAGMRGIVTLAAAFALPVTLPDGSAFPYRDLIVLCAFGVVFGTLVLQGFTMKPIIRLLNLTDDDPVAAEIRSGRALMYQALLDAISGDESLHAKLLRKEYQSVVDLNAGEESAMPLSEVPGGQIRRSAIDAARQKAVALRNEDVIGDNAYRVLMQELDWAELAAGSSDASA